MARIRKIAICNFRAIKSFVWVPSDGINCLIGPGDSGKSTVLDAIDLCLGARRTVQFTDADFHNLDVGVPIRIEITIGELDDNLKSLEHYGHFLRGFNSQKGEIEDEPGSGLEGVLTLRLTVESDLEPQWALISDRAQAQDFTRNLRWDDRLRIAPTRIGTLAGSNLGWRRGSILNRLTDEKADGSLVSTALLGAARQARDSFGEKAEEQLGETLKIVKAVATDLGVDIGDKARALLDAHSLNLSEGTISLHDDDGVPLRGLGTGSIRLLLAGLQGKGAARSRIVLVDELEYGLEPHRIIRFLGSLGSKEKTPPLQAFMTTHSPVALRELAGDQVFVLREKDGKHDARRVGNGNNGIQGTIRLYPDAFLASSILVCEGASEVGLVRGLDQWRVVQGCVSIFACGAALVDCTGGDADRPFERAAAFRELAYRGAVLRDDDKKPSPGKEQEFVDAGGATFSWRDGRALEDELFLALPTPAVSKMIDQAITLLGDSLINDHIKTKSNNNNDLSNIRDEIATTDLSQDSRRTLGAAARNKKTPWFKTVTRMEEVARDIVGPHLHDADEGFRRIIGEIFHWATDGRG